MTCETPCGYKAIADKQNIEIGEWRDKYVHLFKNYYELLKKYREMEKYFQHLPHCRPYDPQGCTCGFYKIKNK